MDWSPPSSTASSLYGDDELYDPNEFAHAPRIHPRASEVPPDNTSGSLFPSPSFNPSGPPHPAPSSELTPSFWLVADPNANPLARVGADVPLPSPEDEEIDMVIIGSGITGVSFLLNAVKTLMKQTPEDEVNDNGGESKKPFKIVMLEARDFCRSFHYILHVHVDLRTHHVNVHFIMAFKPRHLSLQALERQVETVDT